MAATATATATAAAVSTFPFLRILDTHRAIVCLPCQKAVPALDLDHHLLTYHRILGRARSAGLRAFFTAHPLDSLRQRHDDFGAREDGSDPILEFPVVAGYTCQAPGCRYLTRNRDAVMTHVSKVHGLRGIEGKQMWTEACLQQWFNTDKKRCRWWTVSLSSETEDLPDEVAVGAAATDPQGSTEASQVVHEHNDIDEHEDDNEDMFDVDMSAANTIILQKPGVERDVERDASRNISSLPNPLLTQSRPQPRPQPGSLSEFMASNTVEPKEMTEENLKAHREEVYKMREYFQHKFMDLHGRRQSPCNGPTFIGKGFYATDDMIDFRGIVLDHY